MANSDKVTIAVRQAAGQLMNGHDFTTPVKLRLLEKLKQVLPGALAGVQLYDNGTTAVEAGCVTPEETGLRHELFTAALESHQRSQVVSVKSAEK